MTEHNDALAGAGGPDDEFLDVIVVGGSQAGLAMAWHLARQQLRFVVLEAAPEIGDTWRSRWDSLTLFTPTQHNALPGMPFPGPLDTYPTKEIWATGYRPDYSWISIPGVTRDGQVIHRRGVTEIPGLYCLGLSWQHTRGSALLGFVHEDAAYLAGFITSHARAADAAASRPASQRPA
jgi:glycine/D-amino acid oxidase-like deaminating enzyme